MRGHNPPEPGGLPIAIMPGVFGVAKAWAAVVPEGCRLEPVDFAPEPGGGGPLFCFFLFSGVVPCCHEV